MTVHTQQPLSAEQKHYEQKLSQAAGLALGQNWRTCWPEHDLDNHPLGFLSELGPFGSIQKLIARAEDRMNGKEAVCFIEHITLPWTIQLGAAWNLDPNFFISHVKPLTEIEATHTLYECRVPNAKGGLRSYREKQSWATIRGYIDYGKSRRPLAESDLVDTTKRRHELSLYETRQSHTNFSFYRVSESLRKLLGPVQVLFQCS